MKTPSIELAQQFFPFSAKDLGKLLSKTSSGQASEG
jgi:hypothetical protein